MSRSGTADAHITKTKTKKRLLSPRALIRANMCSSTRHTHIHIPRHRRAHTTTKQMRLKIHVDFNATRLFALSKQFRSLLCRFVCMPMRACVCVCVLADTPAIMRQFARFFTRDFLKFFPLAPLNTFLLRVFISI